MTAKMKHNIEVLSHHGQSLAAPAQLSASFELEKKRSAMTINDMYF
jgi:hypothetical protein